jgi:hypothetical protein
MKLKIPMILTGSVIRMLPYAPIALTNPVNHTVTHRFTQVLLRP